MLRVGLTGGMGSGKSTVASRLAELGASVLYADEIGRGLMQPGQQVYAQIVAFFGPSVVAMDGSLNRPELARIAFAGGRIAELEAIVHPATIARQTELVEEITLRDPDAVVVIESALIFETKYGGEGGWQQRFDKLILVRAPEELKIARFVARAVSGRAATEAERQGLETEARRRLAQQLGDDNKAVRCDYVLTNQGTVEDLVAQVDALWPVLSAAAKRRQPLS